MLRGRGVWVGVGLATGVLKTEGRAGRVSVNPSVRDACAVRLFGH